MSIDERDAVLRHKIDLLRTRLLNLSTRNKLLSTKFSDRSRQHFRVIDELPDVLFEKLCTELQFKSLPEFDDIPPDEQSSEFVDALTVARLSDGEFLAKQRELKEKNVLENDSTWDDIERDLRDRVREAFKLPKRKGKRASLIEHARLHGLDATYDLPNPMASGEIPEKWMDNEIQLLMVPGEMDRRVDAVRDQARSYEQERGVNVLGVAFGFLEWREDKNSSRTHFAPLILRAARLVRERKRTGFAYTIRSENEEAIDNETLRVRLKDDFGIELPRLKAKETPESYWDRVQIIIESRKGWRIRRWVSVGLFPFENIVITTEIDQNLEELLQHRLVGDILGVGESDSRGGETAKQIDSSETMSPADVGGYLGLIDDADSSQEAAIRRVLAGENLALKGPPGTGKSQTIMNIIGAVLKAGKTVLFVAEKKAALEVVANRLLEADLGELCLELHSDGTKPRRFLDSIGESLFHEVMPPVQGFAPKLKDYLQRREQLNTYVRILGGSYGSTGHSIQEILWLARAAMDNVDLHIDLTTLPIAGPDRITDDHVVSSQVL